MNDVKKAVKKIENLLQEVSQSFFKKGIYVDVKLDPNDLQKIWKYMRQIGIPVMPPQKAHITVVYSYSKPNKEFKLKDINGYVQPKAIRIFGKGTKDSPYALVIEMESPELQRLNKYYLKEYHLKPTYPEYRPHLTLTYDIERVMPGLKKLSPKQKETIENIFSKIIPELPKRLKIQSQSVHDLNTNWS